MADAELCAELTEQLCQLDSEAMFSVVKDALLSNLEVGAQIVSFLTEFLDELPAEDPEVDAHVATGGLEQAGGKSGGKSVKAAGGKTASAQRAPPSEQSDGHCWGVVSGKDIKTGTTIVSCAESGYGPKALVPRSVAEPLALPEGTVVAFLATAGNGPAPVAASPVWALSGRLHQGDPLPAGEYVGQVSSIHTNGTVFIDCPAAKAAMGRDPAAHASVAGQCGLEVGTIIAFSCVASGSSGKVWMSAPCWKCCSTDVQEMPEPFVCANAGNVPAMAIASMPKPVSSQELRLCQVTSKQGNGCGLACQDFEGEIWLDASICELWDVDVNDIVGVRVRGMTGSVEAIAPVFKRMGQGGADMNGFGPYFGELGALKGDIAFVTSEQAQAEFGRDAAMHATILQQCGLQGGEVIAFNVKANASGKIWVSAPCWKCCSSDMAALTDFMGKWFGKQAATPAAAVQSPGYTKGAPKGAAMLQSSPNGKGHKAKGTYGDEPPRKMQKGGKLGPWW